MGKGYNNYMCKKPFHPGSKANIKRAWMAEQKTENEKRKQDELKVQYEKEQDLYNNRALISSESKDKLELNFMYEAPPGAKRERQKEDDEPEYKFEWQRKYNAPREDYAKGNTDIKDQPFGIPVRNVRCIKCHKWGHINTDKECPLYSQASTSSMPTTSMDPLELMKQMKEDGYGLKENVLGHRVNPQAANQQFIPSDESDPEMEFLQSLSTAEKKKLLRKLKKLSKKQEKSKNKKSKKSHKSKGKRSSDSDSEEEKPKKKKKKRKQSSSSSSESSSEDEKSREKVAKKHSSSKKHKRSLSQTPDSSPPRESRKRKDAAPSKAPKSPEGHASSKEHRKRKKSEHNETSEKSTVKKDKHGNVVVKQEPESPPAPARRKPPTSSPDSEDKSRAKAETNARRTADDPSRGEAPASKRPKAEDVEHRTGQGVGAQSRPDHPDGFSHLCPQKRVEANYDLSGGKYDASVHDKFRDLHRDERSPSVKQKYNT